MHPTAISNCQHFFDTYADAFQGANIKVVEIGSQDVNGSLRSCCPSEFEYCGVDFVAGKGVDLILEDPYTLPFEAASVDMVLSSSCFEHSELFWVLFLEIMRILKPHGLLYLNAPTNGVFHRYPVDCWRFYPDSGRALVTWAKRNGMNPALLESFVSDQVGDQWNDFVAIFVKDGSEAYRHCKRILVDREDLSSGLLLGSDEFVNLQVVPEDQRKLAFIDRIIDDKVAVHDGAADASFVKRSLKKLLLVYQLITGKIAIPNDRAKLDLMRKVIGNEIKLR